MFDKKDSFIVHLNHTNWDENRNGWKIDLVRKSWVRVKTVYDAENPVHPENYKESKDLGLIYWKSTDDHPDDITVCIETQNRVSINPVMVPVWVALIGLVGIIAQEMTDLPIFGKEQNSDISKRLEYDSLKKQNEELLSDVDDLNSEIQNLKERIQKLKENNPDLQNDKLQKFAEKLQDALDELDITNGLLKEKQSELDLHKRKVKYRVEIVSPTNRLTSTMIDKINNLGFSVYHEKFGTNIKEISYHPDDEQFKDQILGEIRELYDLGEFTKKNDGEKGKLIIWKSI